VSGKKNAGGIYSIKTDNSSFEKGGRIQIFGKNLNKLKFYSGSLKLGNAYYN
jgi:hypothetical protein